MPVTEDLPHPAKAETVLINGKNIYYESYGEGRPLLFLHGYGLSSKAWLSYVTDYIDEYQVILVDLVGHGRSDTFEGKLSIRSAGEDLKALIQYLELDKVQAIGFSYGGGCAFPACTCRSSTRRINDHYRRIR